MTTSIPQPDGTNRDTDPSEPLERTPSDSGRARQAGRIGLVFWTATGIRSLTINLIAIILMLAGRLFQIKTLVGDQLLGGLYENFVKMDAAHIRSTIQEEDTIRVEDEIQVVDAIQVVESIPVVFPLELCQETGVLLTRNTPVRDATVYPNGSAVTTDLVLKQGTKLNIFINMTVPVSRTIPVGLEVPVQLEVPVALSVPVDIPMAQTELHEPFVGLQKVVRPYYFWMQELPGSWSDVFCGPIPDFVRQ